MVPHPSGLPLTLLIFWKKGSRETHDPRPCLEINVSDYFSLCQVFSANAPL